MVEIGTLHSNWSKCTSSFIKNMICCGFCGFTKLCFQWTHFGVVPNIFGIVVGAKKVVQTLLCLQTQPLVIICMRMYAMHVLNSMNNQNKSNKSYFKAWIIWNKSLLTICWIFNFFHLLIYQWKLNNEIMDSCMAKYNHLDYLTILYSIGIPSFNQLIHQNKWIWLSKVFYTKICLQMHLYKNTSPILKNQIQLMDYVFYLLQL